MMKDSGFVSESVSGSESEYVSGPWAEVDVGAGAGV